MLADLDLLLTEVLWALPARGEEATRPPLPAASPAAWIPRKMTERVEGWRQGFRAEVSGSLSIELVDP